MTFDHFFKKCTGFDRYDWQARLAADATCRDRLICMPTGFGKTDAVTLAWLWNRVVQMNDSWPRRLVLCLPMRTLVEQTNRAVSKWLTSSGLNSHVGVHVLMGGLSHSDWHLEPERETVLIGTQDMLLSRALNRGYGSGRARWPMEYAFLNVDCLWVMDEIQLMGVGLATSAQIQAFASQDEQSHRLPRPRNTWWMSATLQRDWLHRAPDLRGVDELPIEQLKASEKAGPLWTVKKTVRVAHLPAAEDIGADKWALLVAATHGGTNRGITLVVANTVKSAVVLHKALHKLKARATLGTNVDLRLVHSRFRGVERRRWATEFLGREHCVPGANRIIVATQVIEAGVDFSADALVSELAPWASLVQRFGRCARYGGAGQIVIVDRRHTDESAAVTTAKDQDDRDEKRRDADRSIVLPYALAAIEAAAEAVASLVTAEPAALEELELRRSELLGRLYPYTPRHVITRREFRDLFDTGPDLTGADIDISRFVREGDERDVTVWWWPLGNGEPPHRRLRPEHDAFCRVPVVEAREWLVGRATKTDDGESVVESPDEGSKSRVLPRAWVWSYLDGAWERLDRRHLYSGQTIVVDQSAGGYDEQVGFTGKPGNISVVADHARGVEPVDSADEQEDSNEGAGEGTRQYKTIATHGAEVAAKAYEVGRSLRLHERLTDIVALAALSHDPGKAHPAFAGAIGDRNSIAPEIPLAKAPKGRWHDARHMYDHSALRQRPGFRHEFASALALLEMAWRARPDHPALHGGREEMMDLTVGREHPSDSERIHEPQGLIASLIGLDETSYNLVAYLVLSHHGKIRATLAMTPRDQANPDSNGSLPIRGVREGDVLPALTLVDREGHDFELPQVTLHLEPAKLGLSPRYGPSWVERVLGLRDCYGDFQLIWLEALLRVADVRASRIDRPLDPRLPPDVAEVPAIAPTADPDVDLREWVARTLASSAEREPQVPATVRGKGRDRTKSKPPRSSTKTSRSVRGGA